MTLDEKLGELVLDTSGAYENVNAGVPRLCIPSLTLSDGPWGLAFGDTGVTLLPAPLAVGATFDTSTALQYGDGRRAEAAGPGHRRQPGPEPQHRPGPRRAGGPTSPTGRTRSSPPASAWPTSRASSHAGSMADAKHLAVYNQETDRGVARRPGAHPGPAGDLPPAVQGGGHPGPRGHAHVRLPAAQRDLPVPGPGPRPDCSSSGASPGSSAPTSAPSTTSRCALGSGVDLLKPGAADELDGLATGALSLSTVDADVDRVLHRDVRLRRGRAGPRPAPPGPRSTPPRHTAFALTTAERSAVLLKNASGRASAVRPARRARWRSSAPTPRPARSPRASARPTSWPRSRRRPWPGSPPPWPAQATVAYAEGGVDDPAPPDGARPPT